MWHLHLLFHQSEIMNSAMQTRLDQLLQTSLERLQSEFATGFEMLAKQLQDLQIGWEKDVEMLNSQLKSLQDRVARLEEESPEDSEESDDLDEDDD